MSYLTGEDLFKSAVAEHVAETNHVTGWEEAKIFDRESHRKTRELKEFFRKDPEKKKVGLQQRPNYH